MIIYKNGLRGWLFISGFLQRDERNAGRADQFFYQSNILIGLMIPARFNATSKRL